MLLHLRLKILHGIRSKDLKLGLHSHSKEVEKMQAAQRTSNQAELAESAGIHTIVNQVAIQAAMAVIMTLSEADVGPRSSATTARLREMHRERAGGPALKLPLFTWNVKDKYVELLNFEMEVTDILQTEYVGEEFLILFKSI